MDDPKSSKDAAHLEGPIEPEEPQTNLIAQSLPKPIRPNLRVAPKPIRPNLRVVPNPTPSQGNPAPQSGSNPARSRSSSPSRLPEIQNPTLPVGPPPGDGSVQDFEIRLEYANRIRQAARQVFGHSMTEETSNTIPAPMLEALIGAWKGQMPHQLNQYGAPPLPDPRPTPQQLLNMWDALSPSFQQMYPRDTQESFNRIRGLLRQQVISPQSGNSFVKRAEEIAQTSAKAVLRDVISPPNQPIDNRQSPPGQPPSSPSPVPAHATPPEIQVLDREVEQINQRLEQEQRELREGLAQQQEQFDKNQAQRAAEAAQQQQQQQQEQANRLRQQQAFENTLQQSTSHEFSTVKTHFEELYPNPAQQQAILQQVAERYQRLYPQEQIDPSHPQPNDLSAWTQALTSEVPLALYNGAQRQVLLQSAVQEYQRFHNREVDLKNLPPSDAKLWEQVVQKAITGAKVGAIPLPPGSTNPYQDALIEQLQSPTFAPEGSPKGDKPPSLTPQTDQEIDRVKPPEQSPTPPTPSLPGVIPGLTIPSSPELPDTRDPDSSDGVGAVEPEVEFGKEPGEPAPAEEEADGDQPEQDEPVLEPIIGKDGSSDNQEASDDQVTEPEAAPEADGDQTADDGLLSPEAFLQRVEGKTLEQIRQDPTASDTFDEFYYKTENDVINRKPGKGKQEGYPQLHFEDENGQKLIKEGGVSSQRPNNQAKFVREAQDRWARQFPEGKIPEGYQINHLIPVEVVDKDLSELVEQYQKLGLTKDQIYDRIIDVADNSYPLPGTKEAVEGAEKDGSNPLVHNGSHKAYTDAVVNLLDQLVEEYKANNGGSLDGITLEEIDALFHQAQDTASQWHDQIGDALLQGKDLPPFLEQFINPNYVFPDSESGEKHPRLSQEPTTPQATQVASATPDSSISALNSSLPRSLEDSETTLQVPPNSQQPSSLDPVSSPLEVNPQQAQLPPLEQVVQYTPEQFLAFAAALRPRDILALKQGLQAKMETRPHQWIGDEGNLEHLPSQMQALKDRGAHLKTQIQVKKAELAARPQKSWRHPLGRNEEKVWELESEIASLKSEHLGVKQQFNGLKTNYLDAQNRKQAVVTWDSSHRSIAQITTLLNHETVQSQIVRPISTIDSLFTETLNAMRDSGAPTNLVETIGKEHQTFLETGETPSMKQLEAMQQLVIDDQQMQAAQQNTGMELTL